MDDTTAFLDCSGCGERKPATSDFFHRNKTALGLRRLCKACVSHQVKEQYRRAIPIIPDGITSKVCTRCQQDKPLTDFPEHRQQRYGRASACRECNAQRVNARAATKRVMPEVMREKQEREQKRLAARPARLEASKKRRQQYMRDWRASNPLRKKAYKARERAVRRQAEGTFTKQDVEKKLLAQNHRCYWCGAKLALEGEKKFHVDHHHALARGGSNWPSNIICACPTCNHSKSARMPWEFSNRLI